MKKTLAVLFLAALCGCAHRPVQAQVSQTVPQSITGTVFTSVSTAQASGCLSNQGQNEWFLFYSAGGATGNPTQVQIRLEGSFNSDSATCATGTWIPISDDGVEPGQNGNNLVLAIGAYPFVRANLVKCGVCDGNDTISASYFATSQMPGNPFGTYGAGQQIRRVQWVALTGNVLTPTPLASPYGSTGGFVVMVATTGTFTGGTLSSVCLDPQGGTAASKAITTGVAVFVLPVPASACVTVRAKCQGGCTLTGGTHSAYYFFYPPGAIVPAGIQPANTSDSEATSATNAAVSTTLTVTTTQRGHLFHVSARCSAGTAQLTVADGATQIWSTAATQVGTSNFDQSWPLGLASSMGNNLVVTLGACGVGNTGTLDVQGSVGP